MARFYFYDEIVKQTLTPVEDIQWLAGQITNLPPFIEGSAVLCGSVSWGKYSWRSDIDVAHFSTIEHPHLDQSIRNVIKNYLDRTNHRNIAPRVDVITIGAETKAQVSMDDSISVSSISIEPPGRKDRGVDVFIETAVLFAEHIGSIAKFKGDPWQTFLDRYLTSVNMNQTQRRGAIKSYAERMTTEWAKQPLHQLNVGPDGRFTGKQMDLISKTENYPINLMRRILADLGRYPRPDRSSDVQETFSTLEESWSKALLTLFESFFSLGEQYEKIIAACKDSEKPLSATEYYEELRTLFTDLPFDDIQSNIWQYLESRG